MLPDLAEPVPSAVVAEDIRGAFSLGAGIEPFATGSVPVFAVGERCVVKLFPRSERAHFDTEVAALTRVDGGLSIPTPRVLHSGERDGWYFVVMTRLSGRPLVEVWSTLEFGERRRLVHDVGVALAELHAMATDNLVPLVVDWSRFIEAQRDSCRERQAAKGLVSPWLDQIDDFLERWCPAYGGRGVLLHTEVMREHLMVDRQHGEWRLSGLLDFEPAMLGAPEYEFASVGIFLTCAEPHLFRVVRDAYGLPLDDALECRIMAYSLLHRYSNLSWYLERLPAAGHRDLESLARSWFAT